MDTCMTCQFFKDLSSGHEGNGECRRNAPTRHSDSTRERENYGVWPTVSTGDWCGQYEHNPKSDSTAP